MKKGYFYWGKSIESWHWGPKRGSPVLGSLVFSLDINTHHKTYHGVGAVLAFPYWFFRIQYAEATHTLCMSKWRWVRQSGNVWGFLDQDFLCLQVSNFEGRWVGSGRGLVQSGDALRLYCKSLDSTSKFVTQDVPTDSKIEDGPGGKVILLIPHIMQTQWRDTWLSSETKIGTQYTCKWSLTIQTKFSFTVRSTFDGTSVVPNSNLTAELLNTTKRTQSQQDVLKMDTKGRQCALMVSKEYFKE
jgi:hypothetical protein